MSYGYGSVSGLQDDESTTNEYLGIEERITIKFQFNDFQTIAQVYPSKLIIADVKLDLSRKFNIGAEYLEIIQDNVTLSDSSLLSEICRNDFGIAECGLRLNEMGQEYNRGMKSKKDELTLNLDVYYSHFKLDEFHSVIIDENDDGMHIAKKLVIKIANKAIQKPFLGGYLNKWTKIEYHDAITQTGPCITRIKWFGHESRDTQTRVVVHTCDDTSYDRTTQAFGDATKLIYVQSVTDYFIEAKPYETYEQMENRINRLGKIRLIQRNFRRYMLWKTIKKAAKIWREKVAEQKRREYLRKERHLNIFRTECTIKSFPKTRDDFNVLYAQVQKWKLEELKRINEMYSGGPRIAELNCLLEKEIQALNSIEKLRTKLHHEIHASRQEKLLDKLGEPIKWVGYRNMLCEMDLLRTQKIRFLTNTFRESKQPMNKEKRLEYLQKLIEILIPDRSSKNVEQIITLVHREEELLKRNVSNNDLENLRERQLLAFVDYIREHDISQNESISSKMCQKCKQVRKSEDFKFNVRVDEANICTPCVNLKLPHWDITIYRGILRSIRRSERQRAALASFAFIVQEEDIKDLIEKVWHGHSILSQNNIQHELRLPRWYIGNAWSPWNCVCLTYNEAHYHTKITNLEQVYSAKLIEKIQEKHFLARSMFKNLAKINGEYVEGGEWWNAGIDGKLV